jgi:hypothetical protein
MGNRGRQQRRGQGQDSLRETELADHDFSTIRDYNNRTLRSSRTL